ncbi:MAG: hypothetical protein MRECE_19c010 [Mycoplasmataceae bacterium CE_OT135]|nr:MAG: hypothetical protein MRECE_19c010 [Mycoplasmataceae bacterium CE_OT135]
MVNLEQTNLITEVDINTRKELWDSLFLFVDFSRMKEEYPNMWNKDYKLLPLPKTYQAIKTKFTQYCQGLNGKVENLINSYAPYFQQNIYPALESPEGDKTLLFRCKRLLNNKVIGESSSLFGDLVIWEVEWRQQQQFKDLLRQLQIEPCFLTDKEDELMANDLEKLIDGRINYSLCYRWYFKWANLMGEKGLQAELWGEIGEYLKKWQRGQAAPSEWQESLKNMEQAREDCFNLGSESISDGLPFFQLGFIKEDTSEGLRVACQNRKGFNLNNPYLRVVWLHQKIARVYVVSGFTMVDPRKLYVSIYLTEDWVWKDLPWIVNSMGSLNSGNHPIYHGRNLPENNKLPHLHFPFCGDLGNKSIKEVAWPKNGKINFALFKIKQIMGGGGRDVYNDGRFFIPGFYEVQKVKQDFWSSLTEKEYQTFIAPDDYFDDKDLFYSRRKQLFIPIPEEIWKVQPHLPYHSTFQFYFLRNSLFTANLDYLDIGDFERNGGKQIKVDWTVRTTPSGTYVIFLSNHIFFKWKIEVRQGIVNMTLVKVMVDGVSKMVGGAKQAIGKFFGIDASGVDVAKQDLAQNLVGRDRGKDFMERERSQRIQEQHTARMFTSTLQYTGDNPIEPSIFYANTVKFPYNLFDYWLRNDEEPFTCRFYHSNNLLNNLKHNNNENPITYPLNITFEKLGNILKPGFYQSRELYLDHDPDSRMTGCFAQGVTFYKDKKEHFIKPDLGISQRLDTVRHPATGGSSYTGQAITSGGEGITVDIPYTADQRGYSHTTYIKLTNSSVMDSFRDALINGTNGQPFSHYDSTNGFCWGCTYDNLNARGFASIKFTPNADCSVILKLDVNSPGTKDLDLKAGTEYEVTINQSQFIFKSQGTTRIEWQKVPGHDNFDNLDWTPPTGSGGETEISLSDPEVNVPEPGENEPTPEPDFVPDPFDPTGGEPEIPTIEPDIPPDVDPNDPDTTPDIDPPPIEIDPPEIDPNDPDTGQDPEGGDPDPGEVDPGGDDDDDD